MPPPLAAFSIGRRCNPRPQGNSLIPTRLEEAQGGGHGQIQPGPSAAMKNSRGLSTWTVRASRARRHRSSPSVSTHEESIHIMFAGSSVSVVASRIYAYQFHVA